MIPDLTADAPDTPEISEQLQLFDTRKADDFNDPAFASNKLLPVHRWIPWVAGYSSEFVRSVLDRYLPEPGVVLDPFTGVGTTLVEASRAGHETLGFEINPYAVLASRVKLGAAGLDPDDFDTMILALRAFYDAKAYNGYIPTSAPPAGFRTLTAFYSEAVLRKVLIVQDFTESIDDPDLRDTFRLAFAATMVQYSNYTYEPSLGTRRGAGKADIEDADVLGAIEAKLRQMTADVRWCHVQGFAVCPSRVIHDSFFNVQAHVPEGVADILITSPPYVNNYHYIRNTRPHLYWLGFAEAPGDTKSLETDNYGKYWQTVRDGEAVELDVDLPKSTLPALLETLRKIKPEKGIYGGAGWANYVATYFNDSFRFAEATRHSLRPGGRALVVVGNSIIQGLNVPVDRYLADVAEVAGLEVVEISIPRETRVGNSITSSNVRASKPEKKGQSLYEAVVHLRRPI